MFTYIFVIRTPVCSIYMHACIGTGTTLVFSSQILRAQSLLPLTSVTKENGCLEVSMTFVILSVYIMCASSFK